ncbi:Glutamate formiminotransferase [Candidatus Syntrophocurvum alkaliphilum]|uniref:glutamate formimidoyltransferase n=1 Tax=Candidatus Syntrophocurvum alkaliphilum TaxID=2293317 RepID=A0A6I6DJG5_9FIRM|nr:glutamate formimidoyltransferase [Candidatus Syntrophocurvum alkaliphilum]QGT99894.1 Glutamate formiminotransferase [Candidatus Syntrophocurvum alkaliphilum]
MKYIHAVPNFSEGSNKDVIEEIVNQVRDIEGIKVIDYFPDPDFNRTVVELIGKPAVVKEALLNMAGKVFELIDMEKQTGNHPRIGALDTLPIFPLARISLEECIEFAEELGKEIYDRYKVPIYFSGENARTEERKNLDFIRKGQYEGLKVVIHQPERAPDLGEPVLHKKAGATIISASQSGHVSVNVILGTNNLSIAKNIAKAVRGPSGGFSTVRSLGIYFEERNLTAVSMTMLDTNKTPIYRVLKLIELEAERYGIPIVSTQLVGTLHQDALINCAEYFLKIENFNYDQIIENHLADL